MKNIKKFFDALFSAVYPQKCIGCSEIFDEDDFLCQKCSANIKQVNINNICLDCGLEKDECVCKYNIYRFNALICVFKNKGLAQKVYYAYKFNQKQHYVNFFAQQMANAIKKNYNDIEFDFIVSVPIFKKYGYDHSGYIAKEISKLINIPYVSKLLLCVKRGQKQHNSTFKQRLNNVENKYKTRYRIDGAKVLLIDDIKTTGATIDECAKMLLFAGAQSVHCVTVLGTSINKTKI